MQPQWFRNQVLMSYTISLLFEQHVIVLHTGLTFSIQSNTYTLTNAWISYQVKEKNFVAIHNLLTQFLWDHFDHSILRIGRIHLDGLVSLRTKLLCIVCTVLVGLRSGPIHEDPKAVLICVGTGSRNERGSSFFIPSIFCHLPVPLVKIRPLKWC